MAPWLLLGIVAGSLLLRTVLPWRGVFTPDGVNFQGADAWYHMRLVDSLVANFPHRLEVDPYLSAEDPFVVPVAPLFDLVIATAAWLIGLGAPAPRTVDAVGALVPAVLGALLALPVYVLAARAFDGPGAVEGAAANTASGRTAGLLAAALVAVAPGPLILRSYLGTTDHHVIEALLAATTLALLVLSLRAARDGDRGPRRALQRSSIAGVALGGYLLSWTSGTFLLALLGLWLVIEYAALHLRGRSDDHLARAVAPASAVALFMVALWQTTRAPGRGPQLVALAGILTASLALEGVRRLWLRRGWRPTRLVGALAAFVALGIVGATLALPVVDIDLGARVFRMLSPHATVKTVSEAQPLLYLGDQFSLKPIWYGFGTLSLLGLAGLALAARRWQRGGHPEHGLLLVVTLGFLVATLGQNRFAYYLSLTLAVLAGAAGAAIVDRFRPRAAGQTRAERRRQPPPRRGRAVVAVVLVAALAVLPTLALAVPPLRGTLGVSTAWMRALPWLRDSTPEPFRDAAAYTARPDEAEASRPAYTVMAWWDFGYHILRRGRRAPVSNPAQTNADIAARFFTETDETEALSLLNLRRARYVVADHGLPFLPQGPARQLQGRFPALATWAGRPLARFQRTYYRRDGSALNPVHVFYPDYYRTMAVRLYVLAGEDVQPDGSTSVVSFAERNQPPLGAYREALDIRDFRTHDEALRHLATLPPGTAELVGRDPLRPCVPIEALRSIVRVWEPGTNPPGVRIFEVKGGPAAPAPGAR